MKKQNIAIIGVIAFVLAVAVGYALFQETLTISGTATAQGNFDVEFTTATVSKEVGSTGASAQIDESKNNLTIKVPKLEYPGAYAEIDVTTTNRGSIPAILESIEAIGLTEESRAVKVSYTGLDDLEGQEVQQNGTQSFKIKVEWDQNINTTADGVEFTITLNYKQKTAQ